MLKQGPPPKSTRLQKSTVYIGIFAAIGIVLCILILALQSILAAIGEGIQDIGGLALVDAILVMILAIPISIVQTLVLKDSIATAKVLPFIVSSLVAGFIAGFIGGRVISVLTIGPSIFLGIIVGGGIGAVFGLVSSLIQATFMKEKGNSAKWVLYSFISNIVVWAIGWSIGWTIVGLVGAAISAAIMMIISGISLSIFLANTQGIEF